MSTSTPTHESLAPEAGIVPVKQRNKAYDKLDFGPGEGGLGDSQPRETASTGEFKSFLAAIASGADPQKLAEEMLATSTGRRRGQRGASA